MGMARPVLHFPSDGLSTDLRPYRPPRALPRSRRTWRLGPLGFAYAAALADILAILLAAIVTVSLHGLMTVGAITGVSARVDPAARGWTTEAYVELYCRGRTSPADIAAAGMP